MGRISFRFNVKKAIEVILWLASRKQDGVDVFHIVKAIFYSDVYHLNNYGRVIFGDTYAAMKYGPIPSKTYDILNNDLLTMSCLGLTEVPFERNNIIIKALRNPNMEEFSESDIEALQYGWDEVKDKSFKQISDSLHEHDAYKKKWDSSERTVNSIPIDFEDLIVDKEIKEELSCTSKYIKI